MDLTDLQVFRTVVREGGVTRAAEKLFRVQSNVTTRVKKLEDDLGVALFLREGKRLTITPAGQTLLEYADRLLTMADEARDAVTGSVLTGTFRLGAMESTAAVRLPHVLADFDKRHPNVSIELKTGNPEVLARAVLLGEIEAAFVAEPIATDSFDHIPAFVERPVLISLTEGRHDTILVFERGCPHRRLLEGWFADQGIVPQRIVELGSYHALLGCVLAGMGSAVVPESVLVSFPDAKRLSQRGLNTSKGRLMTHLIWKKGARAPRVHALIQDVIARRENAWV